MKTEKKRLFYLDVVRAVSAILIVTYHFSFSLFLAGPYREVDILHGTANGSWGMTPVYCFFMVSGAALMSRYGREEKLDLREFYRKRFLGIYPLFWIAYAIGFFAVYWQLGHFYDIPSWSFVWSVLGIDGWIVNWIPTFYMVGVVFGKHYHAVFGLPGSPALLGKKPAADHGRIGSCGRGAVLVSPLCHGY